MNDRKKETDERNAGAGCCGGPAPVESNSCCVQDAEAKASGAGGCGCEPRSTASAGQAATSCCG